MSQTLNQYKVEAAKIADIVQESAKRGNNALYADAGMVARILHNKRTKGTKAALLCGLVVGALCDRGLGDYAAGVLSYMATLIDEGKQ